MAMSLTSTHKFEKKSAVGGKDSHFKITGAVLEIEF